jgi:hypothetical protein
MRAHRHEWQRQGIITAQDRELMTECCAKLTDTVGVAARFLDADDVHAVMRQTIHRIHTDLDTATSRDAVQNQW